MTVMELLKKMNRVTCVDVRTPKGNQLMFSGSSEDFSDSGYTSDSCNTIPVHEIMNLNVSDYWTVEGCDSIVIQTT